MRPLPLIIALVAIATACAEPTEAVSDTESPTTAATGFPLTFENCGVEVEVLSDTYPAREVVLAAEPDIVIGGFVSAFDDSNAGQRDGLHSMGIATYLLTEACPDRTSSTSFDDSYDDIRLIGAIFDVPDRAEDLVTSMQTTIDQTQAAISGIDEPLRVAYTEGGDDDLFVAGGQGMLNEIIALAGAENVFADEAEDFFRVSREVFIEADPDALVIGWCCGADPEETRQGLREDARLSSVSAIADDRTTDVGLSNVVAGIRNADAVRELAEFLYPEAFD